MANIDQPDLGDPADDPSSVTAAHDLPADRRIVDRIFRAGVIDDRGRQEALRMISGPVVWWPWIDKALLFLGNAGLFNSDASEVENRRSFEASPSPALRAPSPPTGEGTELESGDQS